MQASSSSYFDFLVRLADDHLVLGHRLSEWCGHAPMLEEDLAMPNMALDLIGQARLLYSQAGEVEGKGNDEDAIAYLREEAEYRNLLLAEQPNGDFAQTMLRQFYFSVFMDLFWRALENSSSTFLREVASKAGKETAYHVRHCREWILRLGDGTEESHGRMSTAVELLHPYTDELFEDDAVSIELAKDKIAPLPSSLKADWESSVRQVFLDAKLEFPSVYWPQFGGRQGRHGEEMGYLLAELQYVQRAYPGMKW